MRGVVVRGLGVYVGPFEKPVAHVGRGLFMWVLLVACRPPDFHVARTCHAGAHVDRAGVEGGCARVVLTSAMWPLPHAHTGILREACNVHARAVCEWCS